MMLVDSHHSLSLQKDSPSNHRLHQKEKKTLENTSFFFFLELGAQYKTKTRNKENKINKIGRQQETKGKRIVNLILEHRL
jgi:hypothetical protein